jgi:hypothetical protein
MWFGRVMMGIDIDDADEYVSSAIEQDMELGLKNSMDDSRERSRYEHEVGIN